MLERHAPELVPVLKQGVGAWLTDRLAGAMQWLLGVLTAPVRPLSGAADGLSKQFGRLVGWIRTGMGKLLSTTCSVISDGSEKVVEVVDGIEEAEGKGIAQLKGLASSAGDFFGGLWDDLGAPVAEVLGQAGSAAWQKVQQVAAWLWDKTEPIREFGSTAWNWLKKVIGIGSGPDGRNGIIQWVQAKAQGAWDWIKSHLDAVPGPLKAAGVLLALSPAGPVLVAGALAYGVVKGAKWLWKNLKDPDTLVRMRQTLVDEVLPELRESISRSRLRPAVTDSARWQVEPVMT